MTIALSTTQHTVVDVGVEEPLCPGVPLLILQEGRTRLVCADREDIEQWTLLAHISPVPYS